MTRTISLEEFESSKAELVTQVGRQTVLIQKDGSTVAVLTSPEQYETTREAKARRLMASVQILRGQMASSASTEEIERLVDELDTHRS